MTHVSCHCHYPVKSRGSVAPTFLIIEKKIFIIVQYPQALLEPSTVVCQEVGVGKLNKQKAWLQRLGGNFCWVDGTPCLICYERSPICYVLSMIKITKGKFSHSCCCCCSYSWFFSTSKASLFRKGRKIGAALLKNMCTIGQNIHGHFYHQPC